MSSIFVSGSSSNSQFSARLRDLLLQGKPKAIGMATAFLSIDGAHAYDKMLNDSRTDESRVVVGVDGAITHPHAIELLSTHGHSVRFGRFAGGIFHPKLLVGGDRFLNSGRLGVATCGYVGSANFTGAGLFRNLEVMLATCDQVLSADVSLAFSEIWDGAARVTPQFLTDYERAFARAQRRRSLADLEFLEVVAPETHAPGKKRPILIQPTLCSAVWVGLQSSTGGAFQVEFPRRAAEALHALTGIESGEVDIECVDGETRPMIFNYYERNGMYRLNVPRAMPLVEWAKTNHRGALLVWREDPLDTATLKAEIIRGRRLEEAMKRSRALGTWGQTTTRQYGWY